MLLQGPSLCGLAPGGWAKAEAISVEDRPEFATVVENHGNGSVHHLSTTSSANLCRWSRAVCCCRLVALRSGTWRSRVAKAEAKADLDLTSRRWREPR